MPLVKGQYPTENPEAVANGRTKQTSSDNPIRYTMPRSAVVTDNAIGASGVAHHTGIFLDEGDVVTSLTFVSGATAASNPTHWSFGLYDTSSTPAKLAQTADQTTTAWAANTAKTVALTSPYTVSTAGWYYVSITMTADTVISAVGAGTKAVSAGPVTGQKKLARTSGSSLDGTFPATITSDTTVQTPLYAVVS